MDIGKNVQPLILYNNSSISCDSLDIFTQPSTMPVLNYEKSIYLCNNIWGTRLAIVAI